MPASAHLSRAQEKLDIILGQVTSLRARLNWLALQHGLYLVVAIGITVAAVVFAGAMLLSPIQFLGVAGAVVLLGVFALWMTDRKSTRLNSSHLVISYAVFCLKKKTRNNSFLLHLKKNTVNNITKN